MDVTRQKTRPRPWTKIRLIHGLIAALSCLFVITDSARGQELSLSIDDITSPSFSAKSISAKLHGENFSILDVGIGELQIQGKTWKSVKLTCPAVRLEAGEISCRKGTLQQGKSVLPVSFGYRSAPRRLDVALNFSPQETWQVFAQFDRTAWQVKLAVTNGSVSRLSPWFPDNFPRPSAGVINGQIRVSGKEKTPLQADADFRLNLLAFSDPSGLHAADKVGGVVGVHAAKRGDAWGWRADVDWKKGEVFWQPLYFARGGHHLLAQGNLSTQSLVVEQGALTLDGVGTVALTGRWQRAGGYLSDFALRGTRIDLKELYPLLLKPYLEKTVAANLQAQGKVDLDWQYRNRGTQVFDINLHDVYVEDEKQRFALRGVNAAIPWRSDALAQADIRLKGAQILNLPLGAIHVPLQMRGLNFSVAELGIPLLDGKLNLEDFQASLQNGQWQWQFSGGLTPLSMEQFSHALKLPTMQGTLSGVIPKVTYSNQALNVEGALLFKVFDGTVVVKNLAMFEPLGRAPRLLADLDMRNLDLGLLTSAFSFGSMDGRIDVQVNDIELSNWQPVKFSAVVRSSPGDYRRKISQRAVQNISSLGGAGAAAAIQRSFLSFFKEFGYDEIGLSCVLRNGVCLMGGVEDAPQGYVIVKGGGIPAITVIGYNRYVSWDELLQRLKRVTQTNVRPIVQ